MKYIIRKKNYFIFFFESFVTPVFFNKKIFLFDIIFNLIIFISFLGRTAFEKLTELDYKGTTYYTVKNLTLYECQGWCREEPECQAASFR